ncbi:phosphoribosyl-AMP cyclohydrolase [Arsenicitalea aurantiaca]|uniref:Phosphoribosyl-AMP cyclohydrolase n=1 Tax=Arsenicitalea aurantiaca TaxID=1783274 RepID=A0A433XG54_9HYPH|nr:phosphoribosyl-AMP cyclohydrolase [Arsenicitalea aurantiaca]RUT33046.1 phosphoribosyl-AMP cyclohydrolase [Arsenicitalea aurantiaca]
MSTIFENPADLDHAALEEGTALAPRFDANGLVTAITVEAATGTVLMLAHMNAEALALTLETGAVHYYSRSRGKIWKKGESSGEIQKLVEIRTDCDQDAMLVLVEQTGVGAACHTGRKTCFYRRVVRTETGPVLEDTGLPRLFDPAEIYAKG